MKIAVCKIPLRPGEIKTTYPPLGSLAVVQSLRSAGFDTSFYDLDCLRSADKQISRYFAEHKFDIVGISAVVATSYKNVKDLVQRIKSVLPKAVIIVGGALTASSEVMLKFNEIDFCVIGEGEKAVLNLAEYISRFNNDRSNGRLKDIKGLCFLDKKGDVVFTGYEKQLSADQIEDPDYSILKEYSDIDQYIPEPFIYEQFKYDRRSFQKHRQGKKLATVVSSRGCVNRCTFCYRAQKGIRVFSVERVIAHIKYLMANFGVGFISFGDENFGASKKWIEEFVEQVRPLDILYRISGICCENIEPVLLKKLKMTGCVAVHYGLESGSSRMLKVMEKKADAALNTRVMEWTCAAGLQTVPALLIGMPGESYRTIEETTKFAQKATEISPQEPVLGINPLIVLPGTPVYEYARDKGLIGRSLLGEEQYLLNISNQTSSSFNRLNLTEYPFFIEYGWMHSIAWAVLYNYYKKNGFSGASFASVVYLMLRAVLGDSSRRPLLRKAIYASRLFYRLRHIIAPAYAMYKCCKTDKKTFFKRSLPLLVWPFRRMFRKKRPFRYISIRTLINESMEEKKAFDDYSPLQIRIGR